MVQCSQNAFLYMFFPALTDTRSHVKLLRYLEMPDHERKTYINMLSGPTLERMRMARQQRQDNQDQ